MPSKYYSDHHFRRTSSRNIRKGLGDADHIFLVCMCSSKGMFGVHKLEKKDGNYSGESVNMMASFEQTLGLAILLLGLLGEHRVIFSHVLSQRR
jgi:uncharacterized membrane protein YgdD (TMEM256/DUF423 family)